MINNFDYGPLYNEQILLESHAHGSQVEESGPDFGQPNVIANSSVDQNKFSGIGILQARSSNGQTVYTNQDTLRSPSM